MQLHSYTTQISYTTAPRSFCTASRGTRCSSSVIRSSSRLVLAEYLSHQNVYFWLWTADGETSDSLWLTIYRIGFRKARFLGAAGHCLVDGSSCGPAADLQSRTQTTRVSSSGSVRLTRKVLTLALTFITGAELLDAILMKPFHFHKCTNEPQSQLGRRIHPAGTNITSCRSRCTSGSITYRWLAGHIYRFLK